MVHFFTVHQPFILRLTQKGFIVNAFVSRKITSSDGREIFQRGELISQAGIVDNAYGLPAISGEVNIAILEIEEGSWLHTAITGYSVEDLGSNMQYAINHGIPLYILELKLWEKEGIKFDDSVIQLIRLDWSKPETIEVEKEKFLNDLGISLEKFVTEVTNFRIGKYMFGREPIFVQEKDKWFGVTSKSTREFFDEEDRQGWGSWQDEEDS